MTGPSDSAGPNLAQDRRARENPSVRRSAMHHSAVGPLVVATSDRPMMNLAEATDNPDDQGVYWELISRESNAASEFCVGAGRFSPGDVHPPHNHPHAAEFYVL